MMIPTFFALSLNKNSIYSIWIKYLWALDCLLVKTSDLKMLTPKPLGTGMFFLTIIHRLVCKCNLWQQKTPICNVFQFSRIHWRWIFIWCFIIRVFEVIIRLLRKWTISRWMQSVIDCLNVFFFFLSQSELDSMLVRSVALFLTGSLLQKHREWAIVLKAWDPTCWFMSAVFLQVICWIITTWGFKREKKKSSLCIICHPFWGFVLHPDRPVFLRSSIPRSLPSHYLSVSSSLALCFLSYCLWALPVPS